MGWHDSHRIRGKQHPDTSKIMLTFTRQTNVDCVLCCQVVKETVNLMQRLSRFTMDLMSAMKNGYLHVFSDDKDWPDIFAANSIQLDKIVMP